MHDAREGEQGAAERYGEVRGAVEGVEGSDEEEI